MAVESLEERVEKLESQIQAVEERLQELETHALPKKRGWRWFIGIFADSPDVEDVVRIGREWRNADRPGDDGKTVRRCYRKSARP